MGGGGGEGRKGGQLFSDRTTCFLCHRIHYLRYIYMYMCVYICLHCTMHDAYIISPREISLNPGPDRRRRSTSVFFHWRQKRGASRGGTILPNECILRRNYSMQIALFPPHRITTVRNVFRRGIYAALPE